MIIQHMWGENPVLKIQCSFYYINLKTSIFGLDSMFSLCHKINKKVDSTFKKQNITQENLGFQILLNKIRRSGKISPLIQMAKIQWS